MTRRDLQIASRDLKRPWEIGKAFDHSAPCGALKPASEIGHPTKGKITLKVNGKMRQDGDLNQMIWNVPEIISKLSEMVALVAGDIIMTGTPSGVAATVAGDKIECEVEGVGKLSTIGPPLNIACPRDRFEDQRIIQPEISLPHAVVGEQRCAGAGQRDAAVLQHVGVARELERDRDVLLDQHAGEALAVEVAHASQHALHDRRRQAQRGLVEHHQIRRAHQAAADGEHLLLAARQRAGGLRAPLGEHRKQRIDAIEIVRALAARARGSMAPMARFSATDSDGNTWRPSATWPMPRLQTLWLGQPAISAPRKRMRPRAGLSMPAMVRISEVLPAPLAPTMATIAPSLDLQRDAVERLGVAVEHVEVFDLQHHAIASAPR